MSEAITDDSTSTIGFGDKPNYPVKFEDCEMQGGHCWERIIATGQKLFPPPEVCKHCGATRNYTEPKGPEVS